MRRLCLGLIAGTVVALGMVVWFWNNNQFWPHTLAEKFLASTIGVVAAGGAGGLAAHWAQRPKAFRGTPPNEAEMVVRGGCGGTIVGTVALASLLVTASSMATAAQLDWNLKPYSFGISTLCYSWVFFLLFYPLIAIVCSGFVSILIGLGRFGLSVVDKVPLTVALATALTVMGQWAAIFCVWYQAAG